jgi:hypothetical protein
MNFHFSLPVGLNPVAGLALILQYVPRVTSQVLKSIVRRDSPVAGCWTGLPVAGKFIGTTHPGCDKGVAAGPRMEAHWTDRIRPVGFFSPSPDGCIPQGER